MTQLPTQLSQPDTVALADTIDIGVGREAARLLQDPANAIPATFRHWGITIYSETVRLMPHMLLALVVASVIIALTLLLRNRLRSQAADDDVAAGSSISMIGVLIAAIAASAILRVTTLSAALVTFTFFYGLSTGLRALRSAAMRRWGDSPEAVELVITVGSYALLTVGTVDALATLGLNLGGVLAGLGILGLAVGLAAQDSLANLIGGFVILWDRPFRVGHWVRIGDNVEGRVRRMTLRSTRLETLDDGIMVMPNKEVTSTRIYNFSLRNLTRVRVPVDVNYDADVVAARDVMQTLVPDEPFISARPEPFVAVTTLGDSAVRLELVLYITEPKEMYGLRWRLNEAILLAFREAGIEITYPHLNLHLRQGTAALEVQGLLAGE